MTGEGASIDALIGCITFFGLVLSGWSMLGVLGTWWYLRRVLGLLREGQETHGDGSRSVPVCVEPQRDGARERALEMLRNLPPRRG